MDDDLSLEYPDVPDDGVWAILLGDGQKWRHQCGGYACRQEVAEGTAIKCARQHVADELLAHFDGPPWNGWCSEGINPADADLIEGLVPQFVVDRARLSDSCEAWVYGSVRGHPAVLVWENSD